MGAKGVAAARQARQVKVKRISSEMRRTRKPRSWYPVAVALEVVLEVVLAALAAAAVVAAWWQTVS